MEYVICAFIGYMFGCFSTSYVVGKLNGFDIREKGSNNAGASNTFVLLGLKAGVVVGLVDVLKAFLAAYLCRKLFPAIPYAGVVGGVCAVIGHIFPFYMRFKGGKGLASFMGMVLSMDWRAFLLFAVVITVITLITNYIAIATLTTAVAYPLYVLFVLGSAVAAMIIAAASVIMFFKHIINIKRIIKGEEIGLRKPKEQLSGD